MRAFFYPCKIGGLTMPKTNLNGQFARTADCPSGKSKIDYYDTELKGFILEVRQSGGRTYYLRYRDESGKQRQYKIGDASVISFDKARFQAQTIKAKVLLGENPNEQRQTQRSIPTLSQFANEKYLPFSKGYKRSWRCDETFLRLHILPHIGHFPMNQVKQEMLIDIQFGMRDKGYALATANRPIMLLRHMYNVAIKWCVPGVESNPAKGVKLFKARSIERFLSKEETQQLYDAINISDNKQLKYIVPLLLLLGCRKNELLKAKWDQVDLDKRTFYIPTSKTDQSRYVPLAKTAIDVFKKLPRFEGCDYILPNPKTLKPFNDIFQSWDTARIRAGIPEVRIHDLRHSMASNLVNSGRSIYEVAKILGHSQIQTSQRYAHLSDETLLDAVDAAAGETGLE